MYKHPEDGSNLFPQNFGPKKLYNKELKTQKQIHVFSVYISFTGRPKHGAYNYKRSGESPLLL
jgi:hypothetical protein